ncbi:MAG: hypothetical protein GX116_02735 [Fibrobacter sp.]|jgi:hypothetical protein|nr:hypothetical protein [Fibrobacter sp.]
MDNSFRRAIRKMTGASIARFSSRPNRSSVVGNLSQNMSPAWSIALFEHLEASDRDPSSSMVGAEVVSYSNSAWKLWETEFPLLIEEFTERFEEFRSKWAQRFSLEEIHRQLVQGNWIVKEESGWVFSLKTANSNVKNLYFSTIHLMVGDAEKILVMMTARLSYLQERVSAIWYKEAALDPISKLLPCLEASLREQETVLLGTLRSSLAEIAYKRFSSAFKSRAKDRSFSSSLSCARYVGKSWDVHGAYETPFLAYTDDFCDYAMGLSLLVARWYQDKWALYLRGFSRGQLDLFGANSFFNHDFR